RLSLQSQRPTSSRFDCGGVLEYISQHCNFTKSSNLHIQFGKLCSIFIIV
ncbi:hypothetical protein KSS87_016248, partial [Heliosperma pusillum]